MADKVFLPESIEDNPFPMTGDAIVSAEPGIQATSIPEGTQLGPQISVQKKFPDIVIARETLSESLNTKEKRILGSFEFGELGAIQIGKYENGVTGDLRITPDGITARNVNGETTLSLDGTTGDATFKGTVAANDFLISDENGLISLNNFGSDNSNASPITDFTTASFVTASGSPLTFTLQRSAKVLIFLTVQAANRQTNDTLDMSGRVSYTVHINDVAQLPEILIDTGWDESDPQGENLFRKTYNTTLAKSLLGIPQTIDFRYKIDSGVNLTATLHTWSLTYVILGA